ncbi:hypothetical protein D3C72_1649580 [compost metagenome]
MAGVEQHLAARVAAHALVKHLEADAVMQVFAGVDFIAQVDALFLAHVEDGQPAARQFIEGRLDQAGRALRERE